MNFNKGDIINKVFLGGTCNESTWRATLKPLLQVDFFDPVVEDWTEKCQKIEMEEKEHKCNIHLYVITSLMTGIFSIAEAVDSVHTKSVITLVHVIPEGFNKGGLRSLKAFIRLVNTRGGIGYIDSDIYRTARVINYTFK